MAADTEEVPDMEKDFPGFSGMMGPEMEEVYNEKKAEWFKRLGDEGLYKTVMKELAIVSRWDEDLGTSVAGQLDNLFKEISNYGSETRESVAKEIHQSLYQLAWLYQVDNEVAVDEAGRLESKMKSYAEGLLDGDEPDKFSEYLKKEFEEYSTSETE